MKFLCGVLIVLSILFVFNLKTAIAQEFRRYENNTTICTIRPTIRIGGSHTLRYSCAGIEDREILYSSSEEEERLSFIFRGGYITYVFPRNMELVEILWSISNRGNGSEIVWYEFVPLCVEIWLYRIKWVLEEILNRDHLPPSLIVS